MKNTTLFSLIVAMLVPLFPFVGASGYDFSEDFSFVIEDTPQGKFITGWKYDRTEESLSDEEILQIASTVTSLTVPSNVSGVEEDVLASFEGVKDLTIEDSDTPLIGYGGLFKKLEKIYLGRDCTHWNFCGWWSSLEESRQTLKTLIVGDKVTELTSDMFEDNVLEEVSLGKGLKKIGVFAFRNCKKLRSITFPENLEIIDESAFRCCESLTEITIPASVTYIGGYAFNDCSSLKRLTVADSETPLQFKGSEFLYVGNGIYDWVCIGIFSNTIIEDLYIGRNIMDFDFHDDAGAFLAGEWIRDYGYMPGACDTLKSVVIGGYTDVINGRLLSGCVKLESVDIRVPIKEIGLDGFYGCESLQYFDIPETVTVIGDCAFDYCVALKKIAIPDAVTSLGESAFRDCGNLDEVIIGNGVKEISTCCFLDCHSLSRIVIPEGLITIGFGAFGFCESLKNFEFPSSLRRIDEDAFSGTGLEILKFNDGLEYIGGGSFSECQNLKEIYFTESIESLHYAFVDIPDNVVVYAPWITPPSGTGVFGSFASELYSNSTLFIPRGTLETYKKTEPWKFFKNIVEYDPDSEVDAVYDDDAVPGIRVEDGCIILTDADDGEYVEVYGINGTCVYRGSDTVIDSLGRGMYIVRRGARSVKITV